MTTKPCRLRTLDIVVLVAVLAVGLAAMRDGSPLAFRSAFTITLVAVLAALVAAIVNPALRAWCGFAIFGGAFFVITSEPGLQQSIGTQLPTANVFLGLGERWHAVHEPSAAGSVAGNTGGGSHLLWSGQTSGPPINLSRSLYSDYQARVVNTERIGNLLLCWLLGVAGVFLGRLLGPHETRERRAEEGSAAPQNLNEPRTN